MNKFRLGACAARWLPLLALLVGAPVALAAPPTINRLGLRGLQSGATTTLAIDGAELAGEPRLVASFPLAAQKLKPGATATHAEFEVTLDAATPAGLQLVRVATSGGVSNAVAIGADALPQLPFAPKVAALPVAFSGDMNGATVLATTFAGKKGQQIVVELESRRLGSKLDAVVHLLDARRVQLAWGQPQVSLDGDARLAATLPADGEYVVEMHDQLYRAQDGFFRLKIGEFHYADMVYPLGITAGASTTLAYVSTNLSDKLTAAANFSAPGVQPAPWPAGVAPLSGPRPRVVVSDHAEAVESPPAAGAMQELPAAPIAVSGRLSARGEVDRYKLAVTPGQQLRFDVLGSRAGSPIDGVLTLQNADGGQLATNDDRPGMSDPGLDYTVPAGMTSLVIALRDVRGFGSPEAIYRISARPIGKPDFSLSLSDERVLVPAAGAAALRVRAVRAGYDGPIQLALTALPTGVTVVNDQILPGTSEAIVSLVAPAGGPAQAIVSLAGQSSDGMLKRPALAAETALTRLQPWLRGDLAVAVTPPAALAVNWELPADAKLTPGMPLVGKVKIARAAGTAGAVRLALATTQVVPTKKVKVNNQDQQVPDVDRSVRFEGTPMLAADAGEAEAKLLVPADLPTISYDLLLTAELLAADGKTVVASAQAPARRLSCAK